MPWTKPAVSHLEVIGLSWVGRETNYSRRKLLERTLALESGNQAVELAFLPAPSCSSSLGFLACSGTKSMYSPCQKVGAHGTFGDQV